MPFRVSFARLSSTCPQPTRRNTFMRAVSDIFPRYGGSPLTFLSPERKVSYSSLTSYVTETEYPSPSTPVAAPAIISRMRGSSFMRSGASRCNPTRRAL